MKTKTWKDKSATETSKAGNFEKLIDKMPTKQPRTDDWFTELLYGANSQIPKQDAIKVIDYVKEELAFLNRYNHNAATCRLNLRTAVFFLENTGCELLGHSTLKVCLETELGATKSLSSLYREADAARFEVILFGQHGIGTVRESVLRPLAKLKGDEKLIKKAWKNAMKEKADSADFPTAKLVKTAVNRLVVRQPEEGFKWTKHTPSDIAKEIAPRLVKIMDKYDKDIREKQILSVVASIQAYLFKEFGQESYSNDE